MTSAQENDRPLGAAAAITALSASELSDAVHRRDVSCVEVMDAYLDRIDDLNPAVNAIVARVPASHLREEALRADAELDQGRSRGWMHGMPQAPKDMEEVRGLAWTCGSRLHEERRGHTDAPAVARVRRAGAIFVGKTNTPEYGYGSQTFNDVWGATRNPYDLALTVGGSSGGAAAAVAARMLPVADGGDFMGSLRNPAAFTNVIGLRPTQGSFSEEGGMGSLSTLGPIARTTQDARRLLQTMADVPPRPLASPRRTPSDRPMRIGWTGDLGGYLPIDSEVLALLDGARADMAAAGWEVVDVAIDMDWTRLWSAFLDLRAWFTQVRRILPDGQTSSPLIGANSQWELDHSRDLTTTRLRDAYSVRAELWARLETVFDDVDFLAAPTTQVLPFDVTLPHPPVVAGRVMDTYHRWMEVVVPWTMSGRPSLNVPAGFDAGRPTGVQLIGRHWEEIDLLAAADEYLAVRDWPSLTPDLTVPTS